MSELPIKFAAPMVRALLEGRKTQTRRLLKAKPGMTLADCAVDAGGGRLELPVDKLLVPYATGDRLWVREAWAHDAPDLDTCRRGVESDGIVYGPYYLADLRPSDRATLRGRPSIHMPRWASRLTLTVTDVRVQRLQEISEADARAEGLMPIWSGDMNEGPSQFADEVFADLWNSLHGPDAWAANPWVVALTFTVERRNIDEVTR